jgi:hypothetical protein
MNIITTDRGVKVDLDQETGHKDKVVGVFASCEGYHVAVNMGDFVNGGFPIEPEGENEGEDMEYVGTGFIIED